MRREAWRRVNETNYCYCCYGTVVTGWRSGHSFSCDECRDHFGGISGTGCKVRFHEYAHATQLCGFKIPSGGRRCGLRRGKYTHTPEHEWQEWPNGTEL